MPRKIIKLFAFLLCFCLFFEQTGFAQVAGQLNIPGQIASLPNPFSPDKFHPLHLRSLAYDNLTNNFNLLLDKGDEKKLTSSLIQDTTRKLLNYFLVGVTLPNEALWVNLRPDSPDDIIDPDLAKTDVGKVLLEADLQLKKDLAKFTSPKAPEGKTYWEFLYKRAEELFGYEDITIPTVTRPWIVPGEIIIRETRDEGRGTKNKPCAYIYKATLKVMLEEDYLQGTVYDFEDQRLKTLNDYSSQLIRQLIIPKLTKEVNTSKHYASLRQVYYSLIFAQWFKTRNSLSLVGTAAENSPLVGGVRGGDNLNNEAVPKLINSRNLANLASKDKWSSSAYYKAYQKSFKNGEYNIQQPVYTPYGQTFHTYFSGGITLQAPASIMPQTNAPAPVAQVAPPGRNTLSVIANGSGEIEIEGAPLPALPAGKSSPSAPSAHKSIVLGSGLAQWFYDRFGHMDLGKNIGERFKKSASSSQDPQSSIPAFNVVKKQYEKVAQTYAILPKDYRFTVSDPDSLRRARSNEEEVQKFLGLLNERYGILDPAADANSRQYAFLSDTVTRIVTRLNERAGHRQLRLDIKVYISLEPVVNAYCLPDGAVVISQRLLDGLDFADEIAAVLAHELSHYQDNYLTWNSANTPLDKRLAEYKADALSPSLINDIGFNQLAVIYLSNKLESFIKGSSDWTHGSQIDRTTLLRMNLQGQDLTHINTFHPLEKYWKSPEGYFVMLDYLTYLKQSSFEDFKDTWAELTQKTSVSEEHYKYIVQEFIAKQQQQPFDAATYYLTWQKLVYISQYLLKEHPTYADGFPAESTNDVVRFLALSLLSSRNDDPLSHYSGYSLPYLGDYIGKLMNIQGKPRNDQEWQEVYNFFAFDSSLLSLDGFGRRIAAINQIIATGSNVRNPAFGQRISFYDYVMQLRQYYFSLFYSNFINSFNSDKDLEAYRVFLEEYISQNRYADKGILDRHFVYYRKSESYYDDARPRRYGVIGDTNVPHQWSFMEALWENVFNEEARLREGFDSYEKFSSRLSGAQKKKLEQLITFAAEWIRNTHNLQAAKDFSERDLNDTELQEEINNRFPGMTYPELTSWLSSSVFSIFSSENPLGYGLKIEAANRVLQQAKTPGFDRQMGLYEYMAQGDRDGFLRIFTQQFTADYFRDKDGILRRPVNTEGISRMSKDTAQLKAYAAFYREAMERFFASDEFISYQTASLSKAFSLEYAIRVDILQVESRSRGQSRIDEKELEALLQQMDKKYYALWEQDPKREELAAIARDVSSYAKRKRLEYITIRRMRQLLYADVVNDAFLANASLADFDSEAMQARLVEKLSLLPIPQLQDLTDILRILFALSNSEILPRQSQIQQSGLITPSRSRLINQELLANYYGADSDEMAFLHPVIEAKLANFKQYAAALSVSSWKDLEEAYYFIIRYSPPGRQKRELLTNIRHRLIKEGEFSDVYTFVASELGYGNFDALYYFRQERVDTDAEYAQYQQLVSVYEKGNSLDGKLMLGGFMALDKALEDLKIDERQAMDFMGAIVTGDDDYLASVVMEMIYKLRSAKKQADVDVDTLTEIERVDDWMNRLYSMTQLERFIFFQRLLSKYNSIFFRTENLEKLSGWILKNVSGMKPEELRLMQNILVAFLSNVDQSELTLFLSKVLSEHSLVGDPAYTHRGTVMQWFSTAQQNDPYSANYRIERRLPSYERFYKEIYEPTQELLRLDEQKHYAYSRRDRKDYDKKIKGYKQYRQYKKYVAEWYGGDVAKSFLAYVKDNPAYIPDNEIEAVYAEFNPGESMIHPELRNLRAKEREYYRLMNEALQFKAEVSKTKAMSVNLAKFIATAGQAVGALGVRFLQVFGQYYTIPREYKEEFSNVYDNASTLVKSNLFQSLAVEIERMKTLRDSVWIKSAAYTEWSRRLVEMHQTISLTEYLKQFRAESINFLGYSLSLSDSPLQDYDQRIFLSLFSQNCRHKGLSEYSEHTAAAFEEVFTQTMASFKEFYTAQIEAAEYLKTHLTIEKVLGGGSINTAYLVSVVQPDGTVSKQVVKIISPNLEVLLGERAEQMQKTVKDLIAKDPQKEQQYIMAERLLGTLRLWVKDDINDGFFLSDDAIFSSDTFYPVSGSITTSHVLQPYGYRIKVEAYAEGDTLKKILNGGGQVVPAETDSRGRVKDPELKAALSSLVKDYLTHLFTPVADSYSGETVYMAHSDFHIGNLMINKKSDGTYEKVVIDRNYYLKLLPVDIDLISLLSTAVKFNFMAKVDALIDYLLQANPDKGDQVNVRQEVRSIILRKIFSWSTIIDFIRRKDISSSIANTIMSEFEKRGYETPLRMRLFFKNVSAINNLLKYVDGSSLFDSIKKYIPATKKSRVLVGIQTTRPTMNTDQQTVSQIGKQAQVEGVVGNMAEVRDSQGNLRDLSLTPQGPIDIALLRIQLEAMPIDQTHKQMLLSLLSLLEKSLPGERPQFYTFSDLIGDLFGFARPQDNLIALHETLARNPIALFHEIVEYLIKANLLSLKLQDKTIIVSLRDVISEPFGEIGRITLSNEALQFIRQENWPANWQQDSHYLLRALQRQVFGKTDEELTQQIKEEQIKAMVPAFAEFLEKGFDLSLGELVVGREDEGLQAILRDFISENPAFAQFFEQGVLTIEEFFDIFLRQNGIPDAILKLDSRMKGLQERFNRAIGRRLRGITDKTASMNKLIAEFQAAEKRFLKSKSQEIAKEILVAYRHKISFMLNNAASSALGQGNLEEAQDFVSYRRAFNPAGIRDLSERMLEEEMEEAKTDPLIKRLLVYGYRISRDHFFRSFAGRYPSFKQGWKLHISGDVEYALQIVEITTEILRNRNAGHKVANGLSKLKGLKGTQVGKLLTAYPASDGEALALAKELDEALKGRGLTGPIVPSDKMFGESGLVFYRYGVISSTGNQEEDETLINPGTGQRVPDGRQEYNPLNLRDPFVEEEDGFDSSSGPGTPAAGQTMGEEGEIEAYIIGLKNADPKVREGAKRNLIAMAEGRAQEMIELLQQALNRHKDEPDIRDSINQVIEGIRAAEKAPPAAPDSVAGKGGIDGSAGSPSTPTTKIGGVDFRSMPMQIGSVEVSPPQHIDNQEFAEVGPRINLDLQAQEIQRAIDSGVMPQEEKIREYLSACCDSGVYTQNVNQALIVIADILRLEEDYCLPTEGYLKEFLVKFESGAPA